MNYLNRAFVYAGWLSGVLFGVGRVPIPLVTTASTASLQASSSQTNVPRARFPSWSPVVWGTPRLERAGSTTTTTTTTTTLVSIFSIVSAGTRTTGRMLVRETGVARRGAHAVCSARVRLGGALPRAFLHLHACMNMSLSMWTVTRPPAAELESIWRERSKPCFFLFRCSVKVIWLFWVRCKCSRFIKGGCSGNRV